LPGKSRGTFVLLADLGSQAFRPLILFFAQPERRLDLLPRR
jgi:hypothetical protein